MMTMMFHSLVVWAEGLPTAVRAFGAAITVVGAVSGATLFFSGYHDLPGKVAANTREIAAGAVKLEQVEANQARTNEGVERVLCLVRLQIEQPRDAHLSPLEIERACP